MSAARYSLLGLICICCAAAAKSQSRHELDTLVFSAHRPVAELPLAEAVSGPVTLPLDPEQVLIERVVRLTETIAEIEREHGINAPALVEELLSLAEVHGQLDDYAEAVVVLERALHIIRTSRGLYSLDQAAAIEAMIRGRLVWSDPEDTLPLESDLQELIRRHPFDPRSVTVRTRIADRRMAAARYYLANGTPSAVEISIGDPLGSFPSQSAPTARLLAWRNLRAARRNYGNALESAIASGQFSISDLLGLEDRIVDTLYFEILHPELVGGRFMRSTDTALAVNAFDVLAARLENSRRFPGTPESIAAALIEIADWRLMLAAHGAALDGYREARRVLAEGRVARHRIDAMLAPATPVFLPDFDARFTTAGTETHVAGWFDIAVEISRYGRIKGFEIVGRSASATEAVENRLRRHLSLYRFRPRFVGDDLAESDAFSLRFHFSYAELPD